MPAITINHPSAAVAVFGKYYENTMRRRSALERAEKRGVKRPHMANEVQLFGQAAAAYQYALAEILTELRWERYKEYCLAQFQQGGRLRTGVKPIYPMELEPLLEQWDSKERFTASFFDQIVIDPEMEEWVAKEKADQAGVEWEKTL